MPDECVLSRALKACLQRSAIQIQVTAIKSGTQLCFPEKAVAMGLPCLVFEICPHHGQGQRSMDGPTSATDGL